MADRQVKRRLSKNSTRLAALRDELRIIDEQQVYLVDDAGDLEVRAIVSDSDRARYAAREASGHAAAMARHRAHVVAEIARLDAEQDVLLDRLSRPG
jgi:hypothetical protein